MQQKEAEKLTIHSVPQKELADACYHSLGLIGRNCEYLAQHFAQVEVDDQTRQAVEDISGAAAKLEKCWRRWNIWVQKKSPPYTCWTCAGCWTRSQHRRIWSGHSWG